MATKFEEIVTHLQTTGFVFQGSQIYGGLQNSWDYGPLGVELKNNIKKAASSGSRPLNKYYFLLYVLYIFIGSGLSLMLHTPQGHTPAQIPQPMHFAGSDT